VDRLEVNSSLGESLRRLLLLVAANQIAGSLPRPCFSDYLANLSAWCQARELYLADIPKENHGVNHRCFLFRSYVSNDGRMLLRTIAPTARASRSRRCDSIFWSIKMGFMEARLGSKRLSTINGKRMRIVFKASRIFEWSRVRYPVTDATSLCKSGIVPPEISREEASAERVMLRVYIVTSRRYYNSASDWHLACIDLCTRGACCEFESIIRRVGHHLCKRVR